MNHLYIAHTTMMLAWEINKYFQGYTSETRIKEIVEFKMKEINRVVKEEASYLNNGKIRTWAYTRIIKYLDSKSSA